MRKPVVRLFDFAGLGLIIGWPSGIIYSNQTGGFSCMQPELEGIFVPVANDLTDGNELLSPCIPLFNYFTGRKYGGSGACTGIDHEDADCIEEITRPSRLLRLIQIDRARLTESHEAWIHVIVAGEEDSVYPLFCGFGPRAGVLTWPNSD
jgi:hypothetical protein